MKKNLFTERQTMNDSFLGKVLTLFLLAIIGGIVFQAYPNRFTSTSLFAIVLLAFLIGVFQFLQLNTTIDKEKIQIEIHPFSLYKKSFYWKDVQDANVIKYAPIREYGGWGYRVARKGIAINPSGNIGLLLSFATQRSILVGTRKEAELKNVINQVKNK